MATIYCVEDDSGIQELILCALQSGGYTPLGFYNGQDFWDFLLHQVPDLILMDIMLPNEDGISLLKKLKRNPDYAGIPIIMLTAKSSEVDKVIGLEAGADDYITKPFGIMELLSRIKAVLRRSGGKYSTEQEPCIQIDTLSIYPEQRTVFCQKQEIFLTYKEYELLLYLAQHKGHAISRDRLLDRVWGFQYEGETRTVDAHIKTLRQKLEHAGCAPMITTVRGIGYKLSEPEGT